MSGRYILLVPALFIDGLQAMLSLGLAGVFTAVGGVASLIPGAAVAIVPIGILLGFVINFAITMTFGAGLIALLAFSGVFYPRYLVAGGGEMIPGLNNLPFWTLFVLLSIIRKSAEEKGGVQGAVIGLATTALAPTSGVGKATAGIAAAKTATTGLARNRGASTEQQTAQQEQPQERVATNLKEIDGIRQGRKPYAQTA